MGRNLRFIPQGGALVEVTCRTIQSRFLLRPSRQFNEIVVGVLGRARKLYPIDIVAFCALSNHYHILAWAGDANVLSRFMCHFNSKLAREVALLRGWHDKVWARRFDAIVVSDEKRAQVQRLRYILSHGVKEGLVERPEQWPGVHTAEAMATGQDLEGYWFNRTKEYAARQRGENHAHYQYAEREILELSPLPCWRHLSDLERRERIKEMIDDVVEEGRIQRGDQPVKGRGDILRQSPYDSPNPPNPPNHSPKPRFHVASKEIRRELEEAYSVFYCEYREAAGRLKAGEREAEFPIGSFPPALPFVASEMASPERPGGGGEPAFEIRSLPSARSFEEPVSPPAHRFRALGDRQFASSLEPPIPVDLFGGAGSIRPP